MAELTELWTNVVWPIAWIVMGVVAILAPVMLSVPLESGRLLRPAMLAKPLLSVQVLASEMLTVPFPLGPKPIKVLPLLTTDDGVPMPFCCSVMVASPSRPMSKLLA